MPGELKEYKSSQLEKAMKAPINVDKLREGGL